LRAVLFSAPAVIFLTIFMGMLSWICSLWDTEGKTQHWLAQRWGRMLLRVSFVKFTIRGEEKLKPGTSYVVVANHASYMDIPALYSALPLEVRFFAKKGLFSIPLLGWHLKRAGHLPVVRDDARASLRSMSEGAKLIRERGISVLLFPEGGRNDDAAVQRRRRLHRHQGGCARGSGGAGEPALHPADAFDAAAARHGGNQHWRSD
jgi:1-acyl-sn-glycerol-3-phosphate acyltransferase